MRNSLLIFISSILLLSCTGNKSIFELGPNQSMSITGLGEGQDAAINPYIDNKSIAVVENLGKTYFTVRIQDEQKGVVELNPVDVDETKEFTLEKGYSLYLDSESKGKAKVTFRPYP